MGSKKKTSQKTTATQTTSNVDNSNTAGAGGFALSGGSSVVVNDLSGDALDRSADLAEFVALTSAASASDTLSQGFDFATRNAAQTAAANSAALGFAGDAFAAGTTLAGEAVATNAALARNTLDRGLSFADAQSARAFDFLDNAGSSLFDLAAQQNALTESTRTGNAQIASDLASRALELAEKRTGSADDKAAETVSGLVRVALIGGAVVAGLSLLRSRK